MTKILVTGGLGFLGQHVVKQLLNTDRDAEIRILARSSAETFLNELDDKRVGIFHGVDVTQKDSMDQHFKNADVVIHLAAMISFWSGDRNRMDRINITGTKNVVELSLKHGISRFVHVSSTAAIKGSRDIASPADETNGYDWEGKSNYHYGLSKYYAEKEVEKGIAQGLDAVTANPCSILGYGDVKFFPVIRTALKNVPLCLSGGSHLVDVRDLAEAISLLLRKGKTGERYLLTGEYRTQKDIMTVLCRILKARPPALIIPSRVLVLAIPILTVTDQLSTKRPTLTRTVAENGMFPSYYSNWKSRTALGWEPGYRLDESFQEIVRYYYEVNK